MAAPQGPVYLEQTKLRRCTARAYPLARVSSAPIHLREVLYVALVSSEEALDEIDFC